MKETSAWKEREDVISGSQVDSVREETPVVRTTCHDHPLLFRKCLPILKSAPNRRVIYGILPFASITLLNPDSSVAGGQRALGGTINLERKSYLDCSSDTLCTREEFGRVTYWSQTLRSWRRWTHRTSTRKDSMRKRWYFPNKENIFPIADGRITRPGGDQELRTSTLVRHRPIQGESNIDFLGESEGSLPQTHDSFPFAGEAINDFWSMSGSFKNRHHVEPSVKLYSPREESFPIPLKYIGVSRATHTGGGGNKKRFHYWTDPSGQEILDLRALQGHSGRNLSDLSLQDNLLILK